MRAQSTFPVDMSLSPAASISGPATLPLGPLMDPQDAVAADRLGIQTPAVRGGSTSDAFQWVTAGWDAQRYQWIV